ncbi:hypothetical protein WH47_01061 [Habropoda laboriosa]|uniref:PiggyBac transposable element-derived protein 4 C-terminal zinc-finger domain-containing protein n=1 Tax=Habropoda laboriosa TaxID=597456 RepID=A0A0L7R0V8_9HYME|nr:hypothetical protein WH47_01061 [Habropoda laboriosa]
MKQHILKQIVGKGKKKYPQKPCKVCSSKKNRSETRYMCQFRQVPLHKGECFTKYHTSKKY